MSTNSTSQQLIQVNHLQKRQFELTKKSCRICLSTEKQHQNKLINPCKCSGSLKHVHQTCLFQWIRHLYTRLETYEERQNMKNQGFQCQICKTKLKAFFKCERKLVNQVQFKKICAQSIPLTVTIIVFFMIAIAAFSYLVYFADLTNEQFKSKKISHALFTVLGIIIIVIFFGTGTIFFIFNYIFIQKIVVISIQTLE